MTTIMTIVINAMIDSLDHEGLALEIGAMYEPVRVSIMNRWSDSLEGSREVNIPFIAIVLSPVSNI
jgi:hypothetical protein